MSPDVVHAQHQAKKKPSLLKNVSNKSSDSEEKAPSPQPESSSNARRGQKRAHADSDSERSTKADSPQKTRPMSLNSKEIVLACYKVKILAGPKGDPLVNTTVTLEHAALRFVLAFVPVFMSLIS